MGQHFFVNQTIVFVQESSFSIVDDLAVRKSQHVTTSGFEIGLGKGMIRVKLFSEICKDMTTKLAHHAVQIEIELTGRVVTHRLF